jgi:hypothetical protein
MQYHLQNDIGREDAAALSRIETLQETLPSFGKARFSGLEVAVVADDAIVPSGAIGASIRKNYKNQLNRTRQNRHKQSPS